MESSLRILKGSDMTPQSRFLRSMLNQQGLRYRGGVPRVSSDRNAGSEVRLVTGLVDLVTPSVEGELKGLGMKVSNYEFAMITKIEYLA